MLDVLVFNVELGQCIFFYPCYQPEYGMMVDCGDTADFKPIDFLKERGFIHQNGFRYVLKDLTLTNYDHDHYSGLPYVQSQVYIDTVKFPPNLTAEEIYRMKPEKTTALNAVVGIRRGFTALAENYNPPFTKRTFYLYPSDFNWSRASTNNLSQIVFVQYQGATVCIPGDLEADGWARILTIPEVRDLLRQTNILIASHHGRENGYYKPVFNHCFPECTVISDCYIRHDTQENMADVYRRRVIGNGIIFNNDYSNPRKVLTTRSDGHILVRITDNGERIYRSF